MAEYLSPGVYVEEVDAGPKPIEGVSTSTAGAIGVTARGPTSGKPELVTSFAEFQRKFGGIYDVPDTAIQAQWNTDDGGYWWRFPLSVQGFFENGGQRLYIKRVFAKAAAAAKATLNAGIVIRLAKDVAKNATTITLESLIGVEEGASISLIVAESNTPLPFVVLSYDEQAKQVTLGASGGGAFAGVSTALKSGIDFAQIQPRDTTKNTLEVEARDKGIWGDTLFVNVRPIVGSTFALLPDPAEGAVITTTTTAEAVATEATVTVVAGADLTLAADASPLPNGSVIAVGGKPYIVTAWDAPNTKVTLASAPSPAPTVGAKVQVRRNLLEVTDVTGFSAGDRLTLEGAEYTVTATDAAAKTVTLDRPPAILAAANFQRLPIGTSLRKLRRANPAKLTGTAKVFADTPPVAAGVPQQVVIDAITPDFIVGASVSIGSEIYKINAITAGPDTLELDRPLTVTALKDSLVEVRGAQITVWGGRNLYKGAIVELDNGHYKDRAVVTNIAGDVLTLSEPLNGYLEGHKMRVIEAELIVEYRDPVTRAVLASEAFTGLRLVNDNSPSYLVNQVNANSKLVTVKTLADFSATNLNLFPTAGNGGWQQFGGGDDALASLSIDDFVGEDLGANKRTGVAALEEIDEISMVLAPNMWSPTLQQALFSHCELLKDRFAILDPKHGLSIEEVRTAREIIDTKYAALYHPWLRVRNPREKKTVIIAPSGHVAGVYARVDVERGVHKAPANELVRGIDLRQGLEQGITKREQDMLNPKGINAIRFFSGRGYRIWGARTLSSDASWKYVNVRRLFIMIEESIDEGTQWAVFEPNDRPLWARVRQTVVNFLTTQWRNGALQGKTAEEAFFVRCDESTMTQDDIDNGKLICQIGIAPVKPAEFVIFRIEQKTRELNS